MDTVVIVSVTRQVQQDTVTERKYVASNGSATSLRDAKEKARSDNNSAPGASITGESTSQQALDTPDCLFMEDCGGLATASSMWNALNRNSTCQPLRDVVADPIRVFKLGNGLACVGSAAVLIGRLCDGKADVSNELRLLDAEHCPKFDERTGEHLPADAKSSQAVYKCLTPHALHDVLAHTWPKLRPDCASALQGLIGNDFDALPLACELLIHLADHVGQTARLINATAAKVSALGPRDANQPVLNTALSGLAQAVGSKVVKPQLSQFVDGAKRKYNDGIKMLRSPLFYLSQRICRSTTTRSTRLRRRPL
jgi:hypothetical protein